MAWCNQICVESALNPNQPQETGNSWMNEMCMEAAVDINETDQQ